MQTIQVVMDEKLLRAANQAAKKRKVNRSALIREALTEHLHRLHIAELEGESVKGTSGIPTMAARLRSGRRWRHGRRNSTRRGSSVPLS